MEICNVTTIVFLAFLFNYSSAANFIWYDIGPFRLANGCRFEGVDKVQIPTTKEDCGNRCLAKQFCDRFTWIDYQNGTQICSIKSDESSYYLLHAIAEKAIPSINSSVCGYLQSSWNEPESIHRYFWSHNCFFNGNTYKKLTSQSLKQCGEWCVSDSPSCTHFSWYTTGEKTCFLQTNGASRGEEFIVPNIICGIIGDTHQTSRNGIRQFNGCEFEGTSLHTLTNLNQDQCESACQNTKECVSFVWMPQNGTCKLKSGTANPKMFQNNTYGPDSVCGYMFIEWTNTSSTDAWAYDCNFPTKTSKTKYVDEFQCAQLCKADPYCNHYTLNKDKFVGPKCLMQFRENITRNDAIRLVPQSSGIQSVCGLTKTSSNETSGHGQNTESYATKSQEECDCECP